ARGSLGRVFQRDLHLRQHRAGGIVDRAGKRGACALAPRAQPDREEQQWDEAARNPSLLEDRHGGLLLCRSGRMRTNTRSHSISKKESDFRAQQFSTTGCKCQGKTQPCHEVGTYAISKTGYEMR